MTYLCHQCGWVGQELGSILMKVTLYRVGDSQPQPKPDQEVACCPECQNISLEVVHEITDHPQSQL